MSTTLIINLFRAIDTDNWAVLRSLFAIDVVYERPGYMPLAGIDRLLAFYRNERVISSGQHFLDHVVVDNGYGACWGRFIGKKKDGSAADELFADVYEFEHGKIRARRSYFFRPAL